MPAQHARSGSALAIFGANRLSVLRVNRDTALVRLTGGRWWRRTRLGTDGAGHRRITLPGGGLETAASQAQANRLAILVDLDYFRIQGFPVGMEPMNRISVSIEGNRNQARRPSQ